MGMNANRSIKSSGMEISPHPPVAVPVAPETKWGSAVVYKHIES